MPVWNPKTGKWEVIPLYLFAIPPCLFAIDGKKLDGKKLFEYEQKTGVLKLNRDFLSEDMLRRLYGIGEIPPEGINILIPLPFSPPAELVGVKKIEYMRPGEG